MTVGFIGGKLKKILALVASLVLLSGCANEAPLPTKPQQTFILSKAGVDSELCKFVEVSEDRNQAPERLHFSYFPPAQDSDFFLPKSGVWKVGIVLLDWSDMNGEESDRKYYLEQSKKLSDWYKTASNGKIKLELRVSEKWSRLNGESKTYYTPDNSAGSDEARQSGEQLLLNKAVAASDSTFDYSGLDVVIYAIPRGNVVFTSGSQGFASNNFPGSRRATLIKSKEETIGNWILSGSKFMDNQNRSPAYIHWAHEMGHMMGLTGHLTPTNPPGNENYYQNPLSGIGLFSDQWSVLRTVEGWNAWMLGWLEDADVKCVDFESLTTDFFEILDSRSQETGTRLLIVRTGESSGIVIESRLFDAKVDNNTRMAQTGKYDGVVMYQMDSTKPMSNGSAMALVPRSTDEMWDTGKWPSEAEVFTDIYFKEGDKVNVPGISIEVVSAQGKKNIVKISKAN